MKNSSRRVRRAVANAGAASSDARTSALSPAAITTSNPGRSLVTATRHATAPQAKTAATPVAVSAGPDGGVVGDARLVVAGGQGPPLMYQRGFKLLLPTEAVTTTGTGDRHEFVGHLGCVGRIRVRGRIAVLCRAALHLAYAPVRHGSHCRGSCGAHHPVWPDAPGQSVPRSCELVQARGG